MKSDLSDLRYFVEVGRVLNLTKAAKNLHITQPSISLAMKRLEGEVGAVLLRRKKSGVELTQAGLQFLLKAREIIGTWEELRKNTAQYSSGVIGTYRLGVHASLGIYILPMFLTQLLRAFPKLEIRLSHNISQRICDDVVDMKTDFGVVIDPTPHPDLVIRKLGADLVGFFAKATNPPKVDPNHTVLIYDPEIIQSQVLMKELHKRRILFKRRLYTQRLDIITALVCQGGSVGILPFKQTDIIAGSKISLVPNFPTVENNIYLIYRRDSQTTAGAKTVARFIEQKAKW